ncbi:MAG: COX15/CtaA family protein [Burkholderiales bacterium]
MNSPDRSHKLLRRIALLCTVLVLVITSLSAYIRLSRAGLSCADWPQCYGERLRQAQQGHAATAGESDGTAVARFAHRIIASSALLLIVTMLVVCFTARPVRWADGRVALVLLALALGLAVLGRWSSDARVPAVAIGNLLGGFAMLALCWRLARDSGATLARHGRIWAGFGVLLLAAQVALGGLVSASFAATSCSGFADCLAAARGVPWSALDPWREPVLTGTPPVNASGALAQALHRISGLAVLAVIAPLALVAWLAQRRLAGALLLALLACTVGLGFVMVNTGPTLAVALPHNLAAALLMATLFELSRAPPGATRY